MVKFNNTELPFNVVVATDNYYLEYDANFNRLVQIYTIYDRDGNIMWEYEYEGHQPRKVIIEKAKQKMAYLEDEIERQAIHEYQMGV